jgi:hypothetical protein
VEKRLDSCQNNFQDLTQITLPDTSARLRKYWRYLQSLVWSSSVLGPRGFASSLRRLVSLTRLHRFAPPCGKSGPELDTRTDLNLQPGELVEVKTLKEILATLDEKQKLRGLGFFREMAGFCGKRFRVYKRLDKIVVETTGELRKIRLPTVLLEGVFCDGRYHGGCDRSCFCYWREAWLRRV